MKLTDQVFLQAQSLAGDAEEADLALLRLLCGASVSMLVRQLREEITPEDCREEFVAAASLYALGEWYCGKQGTAFQEFHAGDLTVKPGESGARSPESLKDQALELLRPYRKDSFCFQGV